MGREAEKLREQNESFVKLKGIWLLSPVFHQATLGRDIQPVFGKPLAQLVGRYQAESSFHLRSLRGLHSCQDLV